MRGRKRIVMWAAAGFGVLAAALFLTRECAYGGGMPGWYRACDCTGIERLDYDATAADGQRRTICLGLVTARKCFQYRDGPEVPCSQLPPR